MKHITEETVLNCSKTYMTRNSGVNVVDLGLIYEVKIDGGRVCIRMTLTTPGCPMHEAIVGGVRSRLGTRARVRSVDVDLVWEPRWTPDRMTPEGREALGCS